MPGGGLRERVARVLSLTIRVRAGVKVFDKRESLRAIVKEKTGGDSRVAGYLDSCQKLYLPGSPVAPRSPEKRRATTACTRPRAKTN